MQMKLIAGEIRRQREARLWSQEHLAELAGISLRTVQRVETEGKAANETAMALAAAFDLPINCLRLTEAAPDAASGNVAEPASTPTASTPTVERPRSPSRFHTHLVIYLVVCSGMLVADISSHGSITWSKWPLLGWGLGLLLGYLKRQRRQEGALLA